MDEAKVFAQFPILKTDRLVLRELCDDDVEPAFQMFSQAEVMRYIGKSAHVSLDETREFLARNRILFPNCQGVRWTITKRGDNRFIGSCGHWRLMKEHRRAEIGYDLHPDYWGQGIMTEALTAILRFGFTEMELHSVEAQIDPQNSRSRQVLLRLGFVQDGLIRENFFAFGKFLDTATFTLLAREFFQANP